MVSLAYLQHKRSKLALAKSLQMLNLALFYKLGH